MGERFEYRRQQLGLLNGQGRGGKRPLLRPLLVCAFCWSDHPLERADHAHVHVDTRDSDAENSHVKFETTRRPLALMGVYVKLT